MNQPNKTQKYRIVHPKTWKDAYQIQCLKNPRSRVSTWLPQSCWTKLLINWKPDDKQYLGGVQRILIGSRNMEKEWLRRALTREETEQIEYMSILYLGHENHKDGSEHKGWHKIMIKNNSSWMISARSMTDKIQDIEEEGGLYTTSGKLSKSRHKSSVDGWYISTSKLGADKSYYKSVKKMLLLL